MFFHHCIFWLLPLRRGALGHLVKESAGTYNESAPHLHRPLLPLLLSSSFGRPRATPVPHARQGSPSSPPPPPPRQGSSPSPLLLPIFCNVICLLRDPLDPISTAAPIDPQHQHPSHACDQHHCRPCTSPGHCTQTLFQCRNRARRSTTPRSASLVRQSLLRTNDHADRSAGTLAGRSAATHGRTTPPRPDRSKVCRWRQQQRQPRTWLIRSSLPMQFIT
jgi:hypothetical protein